MIAPHLALVAVQIMFGTWPIFGKIALRSMSSTSLVGFRIFGAAIVFALLQRKLGQLLSAAKTRARLAGAFQLAWRRP